MALIDLPPSVPFSGFRRALAACAEVFGRLETMPEAPEATEQDTACRDFVLDMMDENPDAFCSEADVQCMMHIYPGRF